MPGMRLNSIKEHFRKLFLATEGAELIEFAASLPLLVVFVVGVYDFSSAFILKQKIAHIAAEAARVAANQPMSDVANAGGCPATICAVRNMVDAALTNNGIDDCALGGATAVQSGTQPLRWTFTGTGGTCTLIIDRGYTYPATLAPPFQADYTIEATKVTLSHKHQWQFNRVVGFIAPGASYANSDIQSVAVVQNLN